LWGRLSVRALSVFEYAVIRAVPAIERGEGVNVAVLLLCRERRFIGVRLAPDLRRLAVLAPNLDLGSVREQLGHLILICGGGQSGGPIGVLPVHERFRWLAAPRSTILQPGPVHSGVTADPVATLEGLAERYL
jgi:Protein of unknown function (DUF3037)